MRLLITLMIGAIAGNVSAAAFDPGLAGFSVQIGATEVRHRIFGLFVDPGAQLPVQAQDPVSVHSEHVSVEHVDASQSIVAPRTPGWYAVQIRNDADQTIDINLFVKKPLSEMDEQQALDDYRIGQYPSQPFRNLPQYAAPSSLFGVSTDLLNKRVSPHFTLGQFLCKQAGGWPKAVIVTEHLVTKLETLLVEVNRAGIRTDELTVMSGFRTPFYNQQVLRNGKHSRHQWGDAADVYIDVAPKDGVMDDLNGDGKSNVDDAQFLLNLVDAMEQQPDTPVGGASTYRANAAHGPFLHIDARGYRARW